MVLAFFGNLICNNFQRFLRLKQSTLLFLRMPTLLLVSANFWLVWTNRQLVRRLFFRIIRQQSQRAKMRRIAAVFATSMFASTTFATMSVLERSILSGAAAKINMLTSAPRLYLGRHTPDTPTLPTVCALRIPLFFQRSIWDQLKAGDHPLIFSSSQSVVESGRILNQGGFQGKEDFWCRVHTSPPAHPEGGCYSKML